MNSQLTLALDELMAYKYLKEAKKLLPNIDTSKINYITDIDAKESGTESQKLKNVAESEMNTVNNIISLFYTQAGVTMFPDTIKEFQQIAETMFFTCLKKGYHQCSLSVLKCVACGVLDLPSLEYPNKLQFLKDGVLDIINGYGELQILSPSNDFSSHVKNIIYEAKRGVYKVEFNDDELLSAFNSAEIGSRHVQKPILKKEIADQDEN